MEIKTPKGRMVGLITEDMVKSEAEVKAPASETASRKYAINRAADGGPNSSKRKARKRAAE